MDGALGTLQLSATVRRDLLMEAENRGKGGGGYGRDVVFTVGKTRGK